MNKDVSLAMEASHDHHEEEEDDKVKAKNRLEAFLMRGWKRMIISCFHSGLVAMCLTISLINTGMILLSSTYLLIGAAMVVIFADPMVLLFIFFCFLFLEQQLRKQNPQGREPVLKIDSLYDYTIV